MNYAETSRRTRVPPSTVYDEIARLADKGGIKKVTVIPDREKVGFGISALIGIETGAEMRVHYMISVTPLALS